MSQALLITEKRDRRRVSYPLASQEAEGRRLNDVVLDLADMIQNIPEQDCPHYGNVRFEGFCERLKEKDLNGIKINILPYADSIHEYVRFRSCHPFRCDPAAELTARQALDPHPSPNVTANHQYFNARAIADKGGPYRKRRISPPKNLTAVMRLVNNREALNAMAKASASLGRTDGRMPFTMNWEWIDTFQKRKAYYDFIE